MPCFQDDDKFNEALYTYKNETGLPIKTVSYQVVKYLHFIFLTNFQYFHEIATIIKLWLTGQV